MKQPDFYERLEELRRLIDAEHVPPWVKAASFRLSDLQKKLFHFVGDAQTAVGTSHLAPGLHASNFLCELIKAYRALDWPKIIVLIHDALPQEGDDDSEGESPLGGKATTGAAK